MSHLLFGLFDWQKSQAAVAVFEKCLKYSLHIFVILSLFCSPNITASSLPLSLSLSEAICLSSVVCNSRVYANYFSTEPKYQLWHFHCWQSNIGVADQLCPHYGHHTLARLSSCCSWRRRKGFRCKRKSAKYIQNSMLSPLNSVLALHLISLKLQRWKVSGNNHPPLICSRLSVRG